jgi:hypothetical protein
VEIGDYIQKALRTENMDAPNITKRTLLCQKTLEEKLKSFIALAKEIDEIKKFIFYGKGTVDDGKMIGPWIKDFPYRPCHSILGLITESGELAELLYEKMYNLNECGIEVISKEYGDIAWYWAQGVDSLEMEGSVVLEQNIAKLIKRYPEKFDEGIAKEHKGD